ncbi:MAG: hypothetical protein AB7O97_20840 [Planctomycetota bacterium]
MSSTTTRHGDDGGFVMVVLIIVLLPLMFLVGNYLQIMSGRSSRLQLEVLEEQALLAAESGIDLALSVSRSGTLIAGPGAVYTFTDALPNQSRFEIVCTYLGGDGIDNDVPPNGLVDAADPGEDVFQVESLGKTGKSRRKVAAYLGFTSYLPTLSGAVTIASPTVTIDLGGGGMANGNNHTMGGTLVGSGDTYALSIVNPPGTAHLTSEVTGGELGNITGLGSPSFGTSPPLNPDVDELVAFARNAASIVVTNQNASAVTWGTAAAPVIVYREGNLRIQGNSRGYGLLVVNGNIRIAGTFDWYGVIVCTGDLDAGTGTAQVFGSVLIGPACTSMDLSGTCDLRYSEEAVDLARGLVGRYTAFNGWQELGTNE